MFKIDKEHELYPAIADIAASLFGLGASILVGSFCGSLISVQENQSSALKAAACKLGKVGLETITMYTVSSTMRSEIDDTVDGINEISEVWDTYKKKKQLTQRNDEYCQVYGTEEK